MMTTHISRENMITFLLTTPMFGDLEPQEIMDIIHIVEVRKFGAGDIIFREGGLSQENSSLMFRWLQWCPLPSDLLNGNF